MCNLLYIIYIITMSSNMGEWKIIDRIDDTNLYNKLDSKITAILNKLNKFNKLR